jgi:hypothetical protein
MSQYLYKANNCCFDGFTIINICFFGLDDIYLYHIKITTKMTFPKEKKSINVEKLSEVSNDNEVHINIGKKFFDMGDVEVIQLQHPKEPVYIEDEWDNIHGDVVSFR